MSYYMKSILYLTPPNKYWFKSFLFFKDCGNKKGTVVLLSLERWPWVNFKDALRYALNWQFWTREPLRFKCESLLISALSRMCWAHTSLNGDDNREYNGLCKWEVPCIGFASGTVRIISSNPTVILSLAPLLTLLISLQEFMLRQNFNEQSGISNLMLKYLHFREDYHF